jgi:hypothetical protein
MSEEKQMYPAFDSLAHLVYYKLLEQDPIASEEIMKGGYRRSNLFGQGLKKLFENPNLFLSDKVVFRLELDFPTRAAVVEKIIKEIAEALIAVRDKVNNLKRDSSENRYKNKYLLDFDENKNVFVGYFENFNESMKKAFLKYRIELHIINFNEGKVKQEIYLLRKRGGEESYLKSSYEKKTNTPLVPPLEIETARWAEMFCKDRILKKEKADNWLEAKMSEEEEREVLKSLGLTEKPQNTVQKKGERKIKL